RPCRRAATRLARYESTEVAHAVPETRDLADFHDGNCEPGVSSQRGCFASLAAHASPSERCRTGREASSAASRADHIVASPSLLDLACSSGTWVAERARPRI